jgi:hypothetical protein
VTYLFKIQTHLIPLIMGFSALLANEGLACSAFSVKTKSGRVVGKTHEWFEKDGMVVLNQRNIQKRSLDVFFDFFSLLQNREKRKPGLTWVSRFASLTFNQYGKEMPIGGVNEKGLVIESLNYPAEATDLPRKDKRAALNELEWIQYNLDLYSSVDEVWSDLEKVRVTPLAAYLHYLICDRKQCAVIEFKKGVSVSEKLPLDAVLTNDYYETCKANVSLFEGFGGNRKLLEASEGDFNWYDSSNRFALLSRAIPNVTEEKPSAFGALSSVYWKEETVYRAVYQTAKPGVSFYIDQAPENKEVSFADFTEKDLICDATLESAYFDFSDDKKEKIAGHFKPLTLDANRAMVTKTYKNLFDRMGLPEALQKKMITWSAQHPFESTCLSDGT